MLYDSSYTRHSHSPAQGHRGGKGGPLRLGGWEKGSGELVFDGSRVSVCEDENVLEKDGVTATQQRECDVH